MCGAECRPVYNAGRRPVSQGAGAGGTHTPSPPPGAAPPRLLALPELQRRHMQTFDHRPDYLEGPEGLEWRSGELPAKP